MSGERAWVIGLPHDSTATALVDEIRSSLSRGRKAELGDRLDITRFEALATRLEQAASWASAARRIAVPVPSASTDTLLLGPDPAKWSNSLPAEVRSAAESMLRDGTIPVLVIDPFAPKATAAAPRISAEEPSARWQSDGARGRAAVESRFRAQIVEALTSGSRRRGAISPSGVQNAVVTEILREFVGCTEGSTRVDVPVEYRDGSRATHPFPLRALVLRDFLPPPSLHLRFALLSIRHAELDAVVDGAWLRNAEVSRPRPAAETDDLVYDISRRQLDHLTRGQHHVRLNLYQTGLETAVIGFYRAVVDHLLLHPRSISVQPLYFQNHHRNKGTAQSDRSLAVVTTSSLFRKGTVWAM